MARLEFSAGFTDVATAAAAWKTVLSLRAPANQLVAVKRVKIHGAGIAGDAEPFRMRLARVQAGTGTATTSAGLKLNNAIGATVQTVVKVNFTSEPTDDGTAPYLYPDKFHPQGGKGDETTFDNLTIAHATELALQVYAPAGDTAVAGHIIAEE